MENATNKNIAYKNYKAVEGEQLSKSHTDISSNTSGKRLLTVSTSTPIVLKPPTAQSTSFISPVNPLDGTTKNDNLKLKLNEIWFPHTSPAEDPSQVDNDTECSIRKRNVNWHSPIHKYASTATTQEKQQQTSPQSISTTSSTHTSQVGDNSSISSGSSNTSPKKTVRIDDCVQEFYDDLINRSIEPMTINSSIPQRTVGEEVVLDRMLNVRRAIGEDDGFESLNGKSSSGEDTNASPQLTKNQLRLRINTLDSIQRAQLDEVDN